MTDELDSEILERLRSEDPAAGHPEAPGERDAVRSRTIARLETNGGPPRRSIRPRLAIALGLGLIVVGAGLVLLLGGSSAGPERALAIDKGPRWITLTIEDPTASDAQMNSELAAAGIESVRVLSVPGPKYAVGNWAGFAEFGLDCQGGVHYFGGGVDIPAAHPYSPANRHSAENLIDLRIPHPPGGAVLAAPTGTPYSQSALRVDADSVNDPHNAAKILVPIRAKRPDDGPEAHQIGVDQLVALGGVFAQYGQALQAGHASCSDFGLKPRLPAPASYRLPHGWVDLHIVGTEAGAKEMTSELRVASINGEVRLVPARRAEVGRYIGLERIPPLPPRYPGAGNQLDIVPHDARRLNPHGTHLALNTQAFTAFGDDRWVFYVGRAPRPEETPQVMTDAGPEDLEKALKAGCPGAATLQEPKGGRKFCASEPDLQLPGP
jgi:hypothetical protein